MISNITLTLGFTIQASQTCTVTIFHIPSIGEDRCIPRTAASGTSIMAIRCVIPSKLQLRCADEPTMGYAAAISRTAGNTLARHSIRQGVTNFKRRTYHSSQKSSGSILEPRLEDHGRVIHDQYSVVRDRYGAR